MIQTTGELRLYPYGVSIPLNFCREWFVGAGLGCHILTPRFKTPRSDMDIKRELGLILGKYLGEITGRITISDTEDSENSIHIYMKKNEWTEDGKRLTSWTARSTYGGEDIYDAKTE